MNTVTIKPIIESYRGYSIVEKQDFGHRGFFINGKWIKKGFVVIYGSTHKYHWCNAMPGAAWFQTFEEAKHGIDCLIESGEDFQKFWALIQDPKQNMGV